MTSDNNSGGNSRRNIFALGFASFFTDISSEMVFSVLPAFLLSLPGASVAILGFIEGMAEALSYALRSVSGIISDKIRKRKLLVLCGYSLSNIVKPFFALARAPIDVMAIRISDRVGKAVRTSPRDALLSESVSEKHRGAAFGLHRTLDQAGAILGPLLASAVMLVLGFTMRDVFWLSLIPGTIALLILLFFVKERVYKVAGDVKVLAGVKSVLKGDFSRLLLIVGIFSLGAFNFSFILLNAQEAGIAESLLPLVYAVVNVAHVTIAIPAGVLSDKIGREKVMLLGYSTFLACVLLMLLPVNGFSALLVALLFGAYVGIIETIQRALIPAYADKSLLGTAYGLYYFIVGSAFFVSNALVGSLWAYVGSSAAAAYSVVTSVIAIAAMLSFLARKRHSQPEFLMAK
ncbi:MAG: MFS transporter [Candidatus Bathyarchaeota archaeon]|nr:MFS transporter [Candidatus Bathyarchaeota archaeon]